MPAPDDRYTFSNESSVPPGIVTTIRGMIVNWDKIPSYDWAAWCTDDFVITLGGQRAQGLESAKAMRGATCDAVKGPLTHVQHTLRDVYLKAGGSSADGRSEVVFTGTVRYTVSGGKVVQEDFATTFDLLGTGKDQYKIKTARIYIDTAALGQAMAELQKP